ncbi:HepT-like ribonuclease domain-containing protein [Clostridium sp.]|uniref:HepT-like ribonuclease domain-containing protein n=1 Tax=Clostridium sp. TaxID=1506 RepID=UPI003D6C7F0D
MNQERLVKIIEDMQECIADINECLDVLESRKDDALIIKLSKSSLRQLFVSFHTILEDFCSIVLKEIKKYRIGITLHESLVILKESGVIKEDTYTFLEKSRLIRNRISHRYKEPKYEELLQHILKYNNNLEDIVKIFKSYVSR